MHRLPQKSSLVAQTVSVLQEGIASGRWEQWLPGEYELSAQLHVSRRTIRAALEELRRKGVVKCRRGKRRELRAAPRRQPASNRVVLVTPAPLHALNPFAVFLIDCLREHLAESGYLLESRASRVPYRARVPQELKMMAEALRPAGWVLLQSTVQMQQWFADRRLPCVVVGSRYQGIELPAVDTDLAAVCRHAVGQLLTRGHRRLVLLNVEPGAAGEARSEAGFLEAVSQSSAPDVQANVARHDGSIGSICARLDSLMQREQAPTGFIVSRARHMLTVLGHLLNRRFRVPQDVALISRDDDTFLADMIPTVARYSPNPRVFASKVSRVVLDTVEGTAQPRDYRIMPNFVPGQTLG